MMLAWFLVPLFGMILLNVPVSFSLFGTSVIMLYISNMFQADIVATTFFRGLDNFSLLAMTFFMVAGEIMSSGGISYRIVSFARVWIGHIRGGLGYVGVIASMIFAGVSGSAVADMAAVGSVLMPILEEQKYNTAKSTALLCAAGCIGPIIPPSLLMIIYGTAMEVSVTKLFLGGVVPGLIIGLGLMVVWFFHAKKAGYATIPKEPMSVRLKATWDSILAVALPFLIMFSIVFGIATPTESAILAVAYALVVAGFVYKEFDFKTIPNILFNGAKSTAVIMLVVGAAQVAAFIIVAARIPVLLTNALMSVTSNPYGIMALITLLILAVGCVMDGGPAVLILGPILLPIVKGIGLSPVYFGVVMTVNLAIGLLTPPVGNVLYVGMRMGNIDMSTLVKNLGPFIGIMVLCLLLITYVPVLVTWLPDLLMG